MASILSAAARALIEFDEVDVRMIGDDVVEYKILTTGMMPEVIELKTLIWSYLSPPVKRLEVTDVTVVERGFVTNRYLVTVRGKLGLQMQEAQPGFGLRNIRRDLRRKLGLEEEEAPDE